jgi:tellurite resistance protein
MKRFEALAAILFIIFGTRGITYNSGKGTFFCPSCNEYRDYEQKRCRRVFTLYFIPIIPLDLLQEYVECKACKGTYKLEALQYDPAANKEKFKAEFHKAILKVMVAMMLVDGKIEKSEKQLISRVYNNLAGHPLTEFDLIQEMSQVQNSMHELLKPMTPSLNDYGKEMVIKAAFLTASADGKIDNEEKRLLTEVAAALEMSPSHLNAIIQEMVS